MNTDRDRLLKEFFTLPPKERDDAAITMFYYMCGYMCSSNNKDADRLYELLESAIKNYKVKELSKV